MFAMSSKFESWNVDPEKQMEEAGKKLYEQFGRLVPGESIRDAKKPSIVWVFPAEYHMEDPQNDHLWWPGLVVPLEYCKYEKGLSSISQELKSDEAVILFFEGPSQYTSFKSNGG